MEMNRSSPGDGLDWNAALDRVGGDVDLLKDIARIFIGDCPRAIAELRDACARGDSKLAERAAHGLKGAAANFGANRVVDASLRLEKMGRAGALDGCGVALEALENGLASLQKELETHLAA